MQNCCILVVRSVTRRNLRMLKAVSFVMSTFTIKCGLYACCMKHNTNSSFYRNVQVVSHVMYRFASIKIVPGVQACCMKHNASRSFACIVTDCFYKQHASHISWLCFFLMCSPQFMSRSILSVNCVLCWIVLKVPPMTKLVERFNWLNCYVLSNENYSVQNCCTLVLKTVTMQEGNYSVATLL